MKNVRSEQLRGHHTRRAFLDAAATALEHQDFETLSIAELAALAKRSVGSFYTKFKDKEDLLDELLQRYEDERSRMEYPSLELASWKDKNLSETIEGICKITIDEFRRRKGLFRAHRLRSLQPPSLAKKARLSPLYDRIAEIILLHRKEIRRADPEKAVRVAFFLLTSVCTNAIVFAEDTHPTTLRLSDDELVKESSSAMYAYLVTR
jgi:AcrR family transcriptional regulator